MQANERQVILSGVVRDVPEIRATTKGAHSATFNFTTCMTTRRRTGLHSTREHRHIIVAYGEAAIEVRNNVKKGASLRIVGQYSLKRWQDEKSGKSKYLSRVVVERLDFADPVQSTLQWSA